MLNNRASCFTNLFNNIQDVKELSLYIHWPFCLSKCPYCDFNSHVSKKYTNQDWEEYYCKEIEFFSPILKNIQVNSIFFGGGTPSLMYPNLVNQIITKIASYAKIKQNVEISLEANPNSSESQKFYDFKKAGINRISVGVQSLNNYTLQYLGRKHSAQEAIQAVKNAKEHFNNVSIDIIYACIHHNLDNWAKELENILHLNPSHISLYQLTIEENTKFHALTSSGKMKIIDPDLAYELSKYTNQMLQQKEYAQYEISNYSKNNNYPCLHNLNYWLYGNYLGIGPGAHSRITSNNQVHAFSTYKSPEQWKTNVENKSSIEQYNILNKEEQITEILFMGLRLTQGINIQKIIDCDLYAWKNIINNSKFHQLIQENLINYNNNQLKLTNNGIMLHTEIVKELVYMARV